MQTYLPEKSLHRLSPVFLSMRLFFVPSLRISRCFADCSTFCFSSLFSPLMGINAVFRLRHAGVALVASVKKIAGTVHSLRLADLKKVHLAQRCAGCFSPRSPPSQLISMRLTHPEQNKVNIISKALFFSVYIRLLDCGRRPTAPGPLSPTVLMLWMNGGADGRAGSSITAAAVYISIRRQTMWEPMCPRMQMPLTGRDGLCDGEQDLHADWAGCDRLRKRLGPLSGLLVRGRAARPEPFIWTLILRW